MKFMFVLAAAMVLASPSFARDRTDTSPILDGSVVLYPEMQNRLSITVTGKAADTIMNSMSNELMGTIDPAQSSTAHRILMKDGKDISCSRSMGLNDTSCTIKLGNVYSGEIGK